jgi:hypothetical protein
MWDDITVSSLPSGGSYAYAGYTAGLWPTFHELERRFPGHRLLDIAVFASDNATCLDIERGDATIAEAPAWFERQVARGVYRPVLYIQASGLKGLEQVMAAHHIPRHAYRIWSAHYTNKAHLCAPKSCGYGLSEADGCQWTSTALGINLDRSLLLPNFFDPRPAPPKPPTPKPATPSWQEAMLNALPTLKQGDKDGPGKIEFVGRMQVLIKFIGKTNKIEAASTLDEHTSDDYAEFGPHTVNALLAVQAFFGLHNTSEYQQRVCGPQTWAALITAHA